jgi:hypothetical protein
MTISEPTWAVVATVDEHPAVVQAFVAWHLSCGAVHIFLYCDRPDDPVRDLLAHIAQITVVPCDDAHWLRLGKSRPRRHQVRQARNAQDAYARCDTDWLVHIDADEFLWSELPVAQHLGHVPEAVDCLIVPVAERVHAGDAPMVSVFDGAFRRPYVSSAKKGRAVFGPIYNMTYKGLAGHAQGKTFVRTRRPLRLSIHRAQSLAKDGNVESLRADCGQLELLHFDGLTPLQWMFKLARMAHALAKRGGLPPSPHRRRQANALLTDQTAASEIYRSLKTADATLQALLQEHDLWVAPAFDPMPAIGRWFPDHAVDLAPDAIDGWIRQNKKHVLAFFQA